MSHPLAMLLGAAEENRPSHEGQIVRLREAAELYAAPVQFEVNQLVTPRKDAPVTMAGEPHLVLAVRPGAGYDFLAGKKGETGYGSRPQVRVLCLHSGGYIVPFWGEAAHYEPYVEP